MAEFVVPRDRDAYFVIRGFRYQEDLTILRWLDLEPDQSLELERGEDIDNVARSLMQWNRKPERGLGQNKHRTTKITLRSAEALGAIANAVEHRKHNQEQALVFRFCTNASPTGERPPLYDDRRAGIEVWEAIRRGEIVAGELPWRLRGIRAVLTRATKPERVN